MYYGTVAAQEGSAEMWKYAVTFLVGVLVGIVASAKIGSSLTAGIALVLLLGVALGLWAGRKSNKESAGKS